jgi:hypothetical protein
MVKLRMVNGGRGQRIFGPYRKEKGVASRSAPGERVRLKMCRGGHNFVSSFIFPFEIHNISQHHPHLHLLMQHLATSREKCHDVTLQASKSLENL